jgi:hypothetical protein
VCGPSKIVLQMQEAQIKCAFNLGNCDALAQFKIIISNAEMQALLYDFLPKSLTKIMHGFEIRLGFVPAPRFLYLSFKQKKT